MTYSFNFKPTFKPTVATHSITVKGFSTSATMSVNSNDGRNIDRTMDIAEKYRGDQEGLGRYLEDKAASILRDTEVDYRAAAAGGADEGQLQSITARGADLEDQLEMQVDDVYDLAEVYVGREGDSTGDGGGPSQGGNISSNQNAPAPGASGSESNGHTEAYFPQDSSNVEQTDFSSFEPFDE